MSALGHKQTPYCDANGGNGLGPHLTFKLCARRFLFRCDYGVTAKVDRLYLNGAQREW
jgi:hypothetical protein